MFASYKLLLTAIRPGALVALALGVSLAASACHPERVRTAPFRQRPDSVEAGSLAGPFTGRVTDSDSESPVAGALVYATWTFNSGYGMAEPAGFREAVTSTDATGRYTIPALEDWPEGATRLAGFHLVIYKRGYVAYRSDRRFSDLGPRRDFAQLGNEVVLQRWRSEYSHARHLRYVGGGPAVAALTAWEVEDAAAEVAGTRGVGPRIATELVPATGRVVAAQLLSGEELVEVTKFDGGFETGPLNDEPDTDTYSSQHFRALGQPESFDVALRVWKLDPAEAQRRYSELASSLPGVKETNEIGDRSLRAVEAEIFGFAFLDGRRGMVVLITCGQSQCESPKTVAELARKVADNIAELTPLSNQSSGE